jgi:hypothetical protein
MTRRRLAFAVLLSLSFVSTPLLAKTSALSADPAEETTTENIGGDEQQSPAPKPATKRPAAPNASEKDKQQTQYRDRQNGKAAPRWHRFIPGMIR